MGEDILFILSDVHIGGNVFSEKIFKIYPIIVISGTRFMILTVLVIQLSLILLVKCHFTLLKIYYLYHLLKPERLLKIYKLPKKAINNKPLRYNFFFKKSFFYSIIEKVNILHLEVILHQ